MPVGNRCLSGVGGGFYPKDISVPLAAWYSLRDLTTVTKAYQNLAATGSGTSGSKVITASGAVDSLVQSGFKLRIGGTDIYTVSSVSGTTINTVETLTSTYGAGSAMALDRISQLNDKSGSGYNATQATALKQLVYNPSQINGTATASGDGASFAVAGSSLASIFSGSDKPFTVVSVSRNKDSSNARYIWNGGRSTDSNPLVGTRYQTSASSGYSTLKRDDTAVLKSPSGGTYVVGTPEILITACTGTAVTLTKNGTDVFTSQDLDVSPATLDQFTLGCLNIGGAQSNFFIGDISEVLVYQGLASATEKHYLNKYLSNIYGIAVV